MTSREFPDWAPPSVIKEWEEKEAELDAAQERYPNLERETDEVDLYIRLLTYEDMKDVWTKLKSYSFKPTHFSILVIEGTLIPDFRPDMLGPKEYDAWLADVRETALKLKSLIQYTDFDRIMEEKYLKRYRAKVLADIFKHFGKLFQPGVTLENLGEPDHKSWPMLYPGTFAENLQLLADAEPEQRVQLDKPKHKNARRTYFVRYLTEAMRKQTGMPLRTIVTKTTATVFEEPLLTERQIIRMAP